MKRVLLTILLVMLILVSLFGFSACKKKKSTSNVGNRPAVETPTKDEQQGTSVSYDDLFGNS